MSISVIILTYNSAATIEQTLLAAQQISDDIYVVDSGSNDATTQIVRKSGASLIEHAFENYSAQRNWAIDNLRLRYSWQLHLDADEFLSEALISHLNCLKNNFPVEVDGYHIPRLMRFMGRDLKHGGLFPIWHLRLFRSGKGRCENRLYDQHFYVDGRTGVIEHYFVDDIRMNLSEWTIRHNRWADLEVEELLQNKSNSEIKASSVGNPIEQKRADKLLYYRFPILLRPFLLFAYRYLLRLGFLDGKEGFIFYVLQTFWFRFLVDAKLLERKARR